MDDIFCIFSGGLDNTFDLRKYYGLSRQATEAMIMVEAYKVLRDRAPYPPDQVIKELEGKFAFILFDSKVSTLFVARVSTVFSICHRIDPFLRSLIIHIDHFSYFKQIRDHEQHSIPEEFKLYALTI